LIKPDNVETFSYNVDNLTGEIFIDIKFKAGSEPTTSGTLLNFTFRGRMPGTSLMSFKESSLSLQDNTSISCVFTPSNVVVKKQRIHGI